MQWMEYHISPNHGKIFMRTMMLNCFGGLFSFFCTYFSSDSLAGRMGSLAGLGGWFVLIGVALSIYRFGIAGIDAPIEEISAFLFASTGVVTQCRRLSWHLTACPGAEELPATPPCGLLHCPAGSFQVDFHGVDVTPSDPSRGNLHE
ncbi:hypothetical protein PAPYR_10478 [Paratrimastix pyriformis]|uniref:Uncharacterized protein n=1 Tax=Paratrimastix pyriformis TaxID=342808 RepID=A0ABQ8U5U9_9EUKA|nr:hypothetical protein PAPYR_10478 [Paratrimastix pyriformis]